MNAASSSKIPPKFLKRSSANTQPVKSNAKVIKMKTFKPNLNVVRKKTKGQQIKNVNQRKNDDLSDKLNGSKIRNRYLQLSSVFSERSAEEKQLPPHRNLNTRRGTKTSLEMTLPAIIKHNQLSTVDHAGEERILQGLFTVDCIKTEGVKASFEPMDLPHKFSTPRICSLKSINERAKISDTSLKPETAEHKFYDSPFISENIQDSDHPTLMGFKLPQSFTDAVLNERDTSEFPLDVSSEGRIGTAFIRKSGQLVAQVGLAKYKLNDISCLYENYNVVNFVEANSGSEAGLVLLDSVKNWFSLAPDWTSFLVK